MDILADSNLSTQEGRETLESNEPVMGILGCGQVGGKYTEKH